MPFRLPELHGRIRADAGHARAFNFADQVLMSDFAPRITLYDKVESLVEAYDWPFLHDHSAAIASYWAKAISEKPAMFNGRILMVRAQTERDGTLITRHFPTDYAAMLTYMRGGLADGTATNGFAMAALTSVEGHVLLGRMGEHTANAGDVYSPGGTPDLSDVRGDILDLEGSLKRELREETGLEADELVFDSRWVTIRAPLRLAFMKVARSKLSADTLRDRILAFLATEEEPELSDILIARNAQDLRGDKVPPFMRAYLDWWFGEGQRLYG
jgi:8-oxo-dGTP pyrophosphatase MutT (NUDIX family)